MEIFAKVIGEKHNGERYLAATAFLTYVVLKDYVDPNYHLPEVVAHTDEEVYLCNGYELQNQVTPKTNFNERIG